MSDASNRFGEVDSYYDAVPLEKDVADKVSDIVEQTIPEENPDKNAVLSKIRGKISISDLIGIIGTIITILLTVYGQISADVEQRKIEQQNQEIIEEFHKTQRIIESNEDGQKSILLAVQQLTDIAAELENNSPPKDFQNEQEDGKLDQPDSNPNPKD